MNARRISIQNITQIPKKFLHNKFKDKFHIMSFFWRRCQTMMLKNLLVRKRHWLLTIFEILCPLALFALLTYVRNSSSIRQGKLNPVTFNDYMTESSILEKTDFLSNGHVYSVNIAYAPVTPFTTKFMQLFNSTSFAVRLSNSNNYASFSALDTEADVEQLFNNVLRDKMTRYFDVGLGIIFENVDKIANEVPKNFKYKIRSTKQGWNTNELFSSLGVLGYGPFDGGSVYLDYGFLALQMAMDKVYLKMANPSKQSNYEMVMQKFPYPAYIEDYTSTLIFQILLPICTMISFVLICPSILKGSVEEKSSGVKELMKMMGLDAWMVSAGWFVNAMMVYTISVIMITVALCYSFNENNGPVITYVHWSIVFVFFFLFCVASVCFIFVISSPFKRPIIAMCIGILVWMLVFCGVLAIDRENLPFLVKVLLGMFIPLITIFYGFDVMTIYTSRGNMLLWGDLFSDGLGGHGMSMGLVMLLFICSIIINFMLSLYIDAVFPGQYGMAKPWYFIFKCLVRRRDDDDKQNLMTQGFDDDDSNYEPPPNNLNVGLKIRNLRKVFGATLFSSGIIAIEKVNLDIYQGQITALLGHNGAGKTTTMSMIAGMFSPSSGSVHFKGYNIFDKIQQFRNSLGLCPQSNLLFSYLNVLEHMIFFGMLKGLSYSESKKEGLYLLRLFNITEKKNDLVSNLSGGMKRKLSLSIALIGNPEVLMLDEPSSGMDPESRREMWDLLSSLRGERTIIITTHFMEEADVLGDRIAIMDQGRVSCYGTPLFLKKLYGTGYTLTIMKDIDADAQIITSVIREHVSGVELKSLLPGQVTYNLPQEMTSNFSSLFTVLEAKKSRLGIKGVGIACTSMEEVFLKVGELAKGEGSEMDNKSTNTQISDSVGLLKKDIGTKELTYKRFTGLQLVLHQFVSLLKKKGIYSFRKWLSSIFFILMPLLTIFTGIRVDSENTNTPLEISLDAYGHTSVYISAVQSAKDIADTYSKLVHNKGSELYQTKLYITNQLLTEGETNIARYRRKMIVAAEFNKTTANGLYSTIAYHSAPISLNLISNAILRSDPTTSSNQISTVNYPIDVSSSYEKQYGCSGIDPITELKYGFLWVSCVPLGLLFLLSDFIAFPNLERVTKAKQLQLMAGISPLLYWLTTFIWDYVIWVIITIAMVVVIFLFDENDIFAHQKEASIFVMIVLLLGVSGIMYTYFFSYLTKTSAGGTALFLLLNLVLGLISTIVMYGVDDVVHSTHSPESLIYNVVNILLLLNPYYAVSSALLHYALLAIGNRVCVLCGKDAPPDCMQAYLVGQDKKNTNGIIKYIWFLALDWVLYLLIILLIDYGVMPKIINSIKGMWVGKINSNFQEDADVRDERDRVDAARNRRDERSSVVLTVDGVAKKFKKDFVAVQGVNFQVTAGECFGILGVNGAGKTTTFRMLTGDELPTAGDANIFKYNLAENRTQFLKLIGYCPQFDAINEVLTGEEMLQHFAVIRGIPSKHVKAHVNEWISVLGLETYRHQNCGTYSGGNKRKLSTAMALIGEAPLVFLDEPTSGVDPVARRKLWNVLIRCQKSGQAIVLTSHSMEECEALCTRLTIMVRGQMMCIGSTQHLKTRYGQGYTIMIKLHSHPDTDTLLTRLKQDIQMTFTPNCNLKDEHQGLLHYHLTDNSVPLSRIFSSIHHLKQVHALIEDYTVADTTLEQVFLAFAKNSESVRH